MTYRIELTKQADRDLLAIGRWISKRSPQGAWRQTDRILDAIQALEDFPHRNKVPKMPGLKRQVRSVSVDSYIVYFRVLETIKTVRVFRIRHGARFRPELDS